MQETMHGKCGAQVGVLSSVGEVAEMLCCSERHVYRMSDSGQMPRPVKVGRLVRWRRDEVLEWVADGCPTCRSARAS